MSLLSWFSRKSMPKRADAVDSLGGPAAVSDRGPRGASGRGESPGAAGKPDQARVLKNERMERREWLYSVVREAMLHAGVLTASFKFKVLALDERGRQFLVMVDLAPQLGGDTSRLTKIESQIIHIAKARYDLVITAVYWRTNEHVAMGLPRTTSAPSAAPSTGMASQAVFAPVPSHSSKAVPLPEAALGAPASKPSGRFEPIQADEVAAFKRALAAAGQGVPSTPGETVRSGPRSKPAADSGYEDTEMQPDHRPDALSNTQYGELR